VNDDLTRRSEPVNGYPSVGTNETGRSLAPEDIATLPEDRAVPPDGEHALGQQAARDGEAGEPQATEPTPEERRAARRAAQQRFLGGIRELAETVILALLFFFALRAVVQNFRVEGSSMVPSFLDSQYVLVNKAVYTHVDPGTLPSWVPFLGGGTSSDPYLFHPPQRGDVIVFHPPPPNDPSRDFIKRVVGVPGDTVDIRDGGVYVNGARISEPFIQQPTFPINVRFTHVALGPNQYYVLGDNRGNSSDSRAWGPITGDAIVGRAWLVYWPLSAIKVAPNHPEQVSPPQAVPPPPAAVPVSP
jgi:signal peptidase I